jgi:c(7)-type cytochrome triheme protein
MVRVIALASICLIVLSCKWKQPEIPAILEQESPVITSLRDSNLPCFACHSYEKFAINQRGEFSHSRHVGLGVHCNHCHTIKPHRESTVNRDICNSCHKVSNLKFTRSGMPVGFTHQSHASKYSCGECHPGLFNMKQGTSRMVMDDMYKGGSCGKCHNGKIAFPSTDCSRCHKMTGLKKEISYPSSGLSPAVFSHELHTAMFDCNTCHTSVFKYKKGGSGMKMDAIYQGKFCGTCHNGDSGFGPMECQRCHK